jgi:hypothetical protein
MEIEDVDIRGKFIEILSNFNFNIIFHNDVKIGNKTTLIDEGEFLTWQSLPDDEYYEFDIEIDGCSDSSSYGEYLSKLFEKYQGINDIKLLKQYSKADCFDLLSREVDKLKILLEGFFHFGVNNKVNNYGTPNFTSHQKYVLNYSDFDKYSEDDFNIKSAGYPFIEQKEVIINQVINFLEKKLEWLRYSNEQSFAIGNKINDSEIMDNKLVWNKNDTDLLELVTALYEMKAINNSQNNLTRKEAIAIFSKIFDRDIKDAESKLSRATDRINVSSFLTNLKESFEDYAKKTLKNQEDRYKGRTKF